MTKINFTLRSADREKFENSDFSLFTLLGENPANQITRFRSRDRNWFYPEGGLSGKCENSDFALFILLRENPANQITRFTSRDRNWFYSKGGLSGKMRKNVLFIVYLDEIKSSQSDYGILVT